LGVAFKFLLLLDDDTMNEEMDGWARNTMESIYNII
jgi:hypothetical protein